jgi:hypothetical protein
MHTHTDFGPTLIVWYVLVRFEVKGNSTASNRPRYVRSGVSRSEVYRTQRTGLDTVCTEDWRSALISVELTLKIAL